MYPKSSVTTQVAVSTEHATSVTVVTTVVTGLMNQLTAVSDSSVELTVFLSTKIEEQMVIKSAKYIEKHLSMPREHAPEFSSLNSSTFARLTDITGCWVAPALC